MKSYYGNKGFTLIELLVVVSIIGFLSSLAFASFDTARAKARDAKRISDLHQIETALELYFGDYGFYPVCQNVPTGECTSNGDFGDIRTLFGNPIDKKYMPAVPIDPLNQRYGYGYYYARGYKKVGNSFQGGAGSGSYIMGAKLEKSRNVPDYSGWYSSGLNYLIGSN